MRFKMYALIACFIAMIIIGIVSILTYKGVEQEGKIQLVDGILTVTDSKGEIQVVPGSSWEDHKFGSVVVGEKEESDAEIKRVEEYEISILSYKEAFELKQKFPVIARTHIFKDMPWPITQSLSIREFIRWLYDNDYKIAKMEGKNGKNNQRH